jgi:hypothetical protein
MEIVRENIDIKRQLDLEGKDDKRLERVEVGKYIFVLGEDEATDKDLRKIIAYLKTENTHC